MCVPVCLSGTLIKCSLGIGENPESQAHQDAMTDHLGTQARKFESVLGAFTKRHPPHRNCQLSHLPPERGLIRLWRKLAITNTYRTKFTWK